jgi:hypothetical protein
MKKQLLIAAVAATMTSVAMADISITGNAKFEYFNTEATGVESSNTANTEVNLGIKGKSGDTSVVANIEINTHGADSSGAIDVEDLYMTTKIADVTIKAGNYASGTSGILGEIDNGGRASNKVTLSTTIQGVKVYAGNSGAVGTGATALDGSMFVGVSAKVAGYTVQAKKVNATTNAYGISGDLAGFGIRLESKDIDGANNDTNFGQITKSFNGVDLAYAWIDGDTDGLIGEDDSAIFAVENAGQGKSNAQFSAKTKIDGNTLTVKAGSIGHSEAGLNDDDYVQVAVSRTMASGAKLALTYTDSDDRATGDNTNDTQKFEADISIKF